MAFWSRHRENSSFWSCWLPNMSASGWETLWGLLDAKRTCSWKAGLVLEPNIRVNQWSPRSPSNFSGSRSLASSSLVSYQDRPRVDGLVWKSVTWQGSVPKAQPLDNICSLWRKPLQYFSCRTKRAWQGIKWQYCEYNMCYEQRKLALHTQ